MAIGWNVVKFEHQKPAQVVGWFEELGEAQDEAEKLNEQAPNSVFYGWEKNK